MAAIETMPDYLVADGGSADPGPVYLGENIELGHFVRDELELFLTESRKRNIPLIIGSAGDSGSNAGVDSFVRQIRDIAEVHRIPKFRLGYFHSEISGDFLSNEIAAGNTIRGLGKYGDLTPEAALAATRIVAVAGNAPFLELLTPSSMSSSQVGAETPTSPRPPASMPGFRRRSPSTWAR
ncbi:MAG: hypothetical protein ACE368_09485 [Paracoccaceae bacterium]